MKTILFILLTSSLFATSTLTKVRTFTQSDGSSFTGRLQGDAFLHWIEADDGSVLLFNKKTGNFEYAKIKDNDIVLSGDVYHISKKRDLHVRKNTLNKESLKYLYKLRHP